MNNRRILTLVFLNMILLGLTGAFSLSSIHAESAPTIDRSSWYYLDAELLSEGSTGDSDDPIAVCDSDNNVHLVWCDWTDYNGAGADWDIFYKKWDVQTASWSSVIVVSAGDGNSDKPDICIDVFGNIHVAWDDKTDWDGAGTNDDDDEDIFYRNWNSTTETWSAIYVLSPPDSTEPSYHANIVSDSQGNLYLFYTDYTDNLAGSGIDGDVFYTKWDVATGSWIGPIVVSDMSDSMTYGCDVTIDGDDIVHIVWNDEYDYDGIGVDTTDADIFYRQLDTSSSQLSKTWYISEGSDAPSGWEQVLIDSNGGVHFVWIDYGTDYIGTGNDADVFYRSYNKNTQQWSDIVAVSDFSVEDCLYMETTIDPFGILHIVWRSREVYQLLGFQYHIFYRSYDTSTNVWDAPQVLSPESDAFSNTPSVAAAMNGYVYFFWSDEMDVDGAGSDADIWMKQLVGAPEETELAAIVPQESSTGAIALSWKPIPSATTYYVYRSTSYIWSVEGLTPLSTTSTTAFQDSISANGTYYYTVVAGNEYGNASLSNVEAVQITLLPDPTPGTQTNDTTDGFILSNDLLLLGGILLGAQILLSVLVILVRKK